MFTRKTYEAMIHRLLKDPSNCLRPKEYRLAKFMLKMIPDVNFWKRVEAEKVLSLTYFLTKENKELYLSEYKRFKKLCKFKPDKLKQKSYTLEDDKVGESSALKKPSNKKLNLLDFIKHGSQKEN